MVKRLRLFEREISPFAAFAAFAAFAPLKTFQFSVYKGPRYFV